MKLSLFCLLALVFGCASQPVTVVALELAPTPWISTQDGLALEIPLEQELTGRKVRLVFDSVADIESAQLRDATSDDEAGTLGAPDRHLHAVDFILPVPRIGRAAMKLRLLPGAGPLRLERIELVPLSWTDRRGAQRALGFGLVLACALFLLLPGLLVQGMFQRAFATSRLDFAFPLSLALYASVFLVLDSLWRTAPAWIYALLLLALLGGAGWRGWQGALELMRANRFALIWFAAVIVTATAILVLPHSLPFSRYTYDNIAGAKTFGVIEGIDNLFQYVNGRALAENEPFAKYYAGGRLVYDVTAREMLPGVVYALFRKLFETLSWPLADSYFAYTLVGLCCNAMVVFPLSGFMRRYFPEQRAATLALLVGSTAFFVANIHYTWFKFAGAALWLSGMLWVLERPESRTRWIVSGLLFGGASVLHTGNLLALPIFVGWIAVRRVRQEAAFSRAALDLGLMVLAVVALQLPWTAVKAATLHSDTTLFAQHFLDSHQNPRGLFASAGDFLREAPLREQWLPRLERVWTSLHPPELGRWLDGWKSRSFVDQLRRYSALELRTFSILFYPLLAFALVAAVRRDGASERSGELVREQRALVWATFATVFALAFLTYGAFEPGLNHDLPNGPILLAYLLLCGWVVRRGGRVSTALLAFAGLQAVRVIASALGPWLFGLPSVGTV